MSHRGYVPPFQCIPGLHPCLSLAARSGAGWESVGPTPSTQPLQSLSKGLPPSGGWQTCVLLHSAVLRPMPIHRGIAGPWPSAPPLVLTRYTNPNRTHTRRCDLLRTPAAAMTRPFRGCFWFLSLVMESSGSPTVVSRHPLVVYCQPLAGEPQPLMGNRQPPNVDGQPMTTRRLVAVVSGSSMPQWQFF
jgi:hypothetical protein